MNNENLGLVFDNNTPEPQPRKLDIRVVPEPVVTITEPDPLEMVLPDLHIGKGIMSLPLGIGKASYSLAFALAAWDGFVPLRLSMMDDIHDNYYPTPVNTSRFDDMKSRINDDLVRMIQQSDPFDFDPFKRVVHVPVVMPFKLSYDREPLPEVIWNEDAPTTVYTGTIGGPAHTKSRKRKRRDSNRSKQVNRRKR